MFGSIIMRGLVMDFTDDPVAMNVDDQYMFGPSLMICPVYEYGARSRNVYLPKERIWYDFYNDIVSYEGGQTIKADAPYERIPIFVPSGSIIITGPQIEYVGQVAYNELTIDVYSGSGGRFILYEDDGLSFDYEEGKYTTIPIYYTENEAGYTVSIGQRSGQFDGMLERRNIKVRLHFPGMVKERNIVYSGERIDINID
jgi:alpha-D-xyloside xylohydrolase